MASDRTRLADFQELIRNPLEADQFVRDNSPVWPDKPTPCNAKGCATEDYSSHRLYFRHWQQRHKQTKTKYTCPCCRKIMFRKDFAKRHLKLQKNRLFSYRGSGRQ